MSLDEWSDAWVLWPRLYFAGVAIALTGIFMAVVGEPGAATVVLPFGLGILAAGEYSRRVEREE